MIEELDDILKETNKILDKNSDDNRCPFCKTELIIPGAYIGKPFCCSICKTDIKVSSVLPLKLEKDLIWEGDGRYNMCGF